MKKNFGQIVLCMLMAVAMGLTACSSDDNEVTTPPDNNENVGDADSTQTDVGSGQCGTVEPARHQQDLRRDVL